MEDRASLTAMKKTNNKNYFILWDTWVPAGILNWTHLSRWFCTTMSERRLTQRELEEEVKRIMEDGLSDDDYDPFHCVLQYNFNGNNCFQDYWVYYVPPKMSSGTHMSLPLATKVTMCKECLQVVYEK
ncbi:unnamed protein product [Acanthoscelides obtectus]|uniref:Uncharacterized protein n=1 Tax=Acanthoscelides obtectus TaxID=200917 RepID=A0A9P0Q1U0_ACAOB|nr:unnamed protein product [Acanthoscelides obtectus]CAK1669440.1 hypothetical protein AOBTE_LOCUS27010 [Acanthoscelides obtectus]